MKKLLFVFLLSMFILQQSMAQVLPAIDRFKLETEDDYIEADKIALSVADYLFATPMITDDENRIKVAAFLNRWMEGTPTYTFMIDEGITEYFDDDPELTDMYMAALTRFTLQNPEIEDEDKISVGALKQLLTYVDNDDNMVVQTEKLKELMAANKKGRLKNELGY